MIMAGRSLAQSIIKARILLKTDESWSAAQVAAALDISEKAVFCAKRGRVEEGVEEVLRYRSQVNRFQKVDQRVEALLIALAMRAIENGYGAYFVRAYDLMEDLCKAVPSTT